MSKNEQDKKAKKTVKQLRAARKEQIAEASSRMKQQKKDIEAIKEQMQSGIGTAPRIAEATGMPTSDVMWYIAALKKYGEVIESEKDGSYFKYSLSQNVGKREDHHDAG